MTGYSLESSVTFSCFVNDPLQKCFCAPSAELLIKGAQDGKVLERTCSFGVMPLSE